MGHKMLYFLFSFALPALSIAADNVNNNTQSSMEVCLKQGNVINAATVADTCFKDLVKTQILNTGNASSCTSLNDFTIKFVNFYDIVMKTCYNETLEKIYAPGKQILIKILTLVFKDNRLADLSKNDQFSCLKNNETRKNITNCIKHKNGESNDTSTSYLWNRRATLNFDYKACNVRTNKMKKCTGKALVMAHCQKPLIEFVDSMFDVVLLNCKDPETVKQTIVTSINESGKGLATQLTAYSSVTLLFTRLIPVVVEWLVL